MHSRQIKDPLVSVIIPTYNRANLLPRAIHSVLNQKFTNYELIIVNDGSTDNTSAIVAEFDSPQIRYYESEQNKGKSAALNTGINISKGNYLIFLDDDDEFLTQTLSIELSAIQNTPSEIGFVIGKGIILKTGTYLFFNDNIKDSHLNLYKDQLQHNTISLSGALIKRESLTKIGLFNEKISFGIDWEFMTRLLKHYKYKYVNQVIYKTHYDDPTNPYHITNNSQRNLPKRLTTYRLFLIEHLTEIKQHRKIMAKHLFRIAQILIALDKHTLAKKYYKMTVQTKPTNLRYLTHYLHSFLKFKRNPIYRLLRDLIQSLEDKIFASPSL